MIGIYKIQNLLTGEVYIGQSKDIEKRFKEHIYHADSYIDQIIFETGKEFFSFEVLENCSVDQLDNREEYYINFYHSNIEGYGYNLTKGGQHCIGESNSNCKITEKDVYDIREAYKSHERKFMVYEKYKNIISKSYFSCIWEGVSWKNVHCDVYTEENIDYYKYKTSIGSSSTIAIFTDEEVLNLRKRYVNESAKEIYESVKDKCSFQTLQAILWGKSYSNIDIYDKKNKKWINK